MEQSNLSQNNPQENQITEYLDELKQIEIEGYELGVKKARNALFWAAGLYLLGEIIQLFREGEKYDLTVSLIVIAVIFVEIGIFIALGFWTKKKPFTAVVAGISYFTFLIILNAVISASEGVEGVLVAIFSGIIIKVIIYVALFRALGDAKELQRVINEKKIE